MEDVENLQTQTLQQTAENNNLIKMDLDNKFSLKTFVRKKLMAIVTFVAIVLGFVIGFTVRLAEPSDDAIMLIGEWKMIRKIFWVTYVLYCVLL